jgi:ferredoxin
LKTHSLTLFTGAVKNMYGCLPGFQKGNWHRRAPKADEFSQVVVDVFSSFQPKINIMDGILAMEGDGPSNGRSRKLGLIITSNSAPALDRIATEIIGYDPDEIFTTRFAELRGFSGIESGSELSGVPLDEVKISDFALPMDRYLRMIPKIAHDMLGKFIWTRPVVNPEICSECLSCVENCPVHAMKEDSGPPVIDNKACINCYCCDEICPEGAIDKKMSWLAKKLT